MLIYRECTEYEQKLLRKHESIIIKRIIQDGVPRTLRTCIENTIRGYRDIVVDCRPEVARCRIHRGVYIPPDGIGEIEICPTSIRMPALLFHELVHSCGGNEFDAEVYENFLFTSNEGATKPDPYDDRRKFEREGYRGIYAYLEMDNVYNIEGRFLMRRRQLIDW
jgi:hypothetical protein